MRAGWESWRRSTATGKPERKSALKKQGHTTRKSAAQRSRRQLRNTPAWFPDRRRHLDGGPSSCRRNDDGFSPPKLRLFPRPAGRRERKRKELGGTNEPSTPL